MTGPIIPVSPGTSSYGLAWKAVSILSVDGNIALVRDQLSKTFNVDRTMMRAKGELPVVGETWIVDRAYGNDWTFAMIVGCPTAAKMGIVQRVDPSLDLGPFSAVTVDTPCQITFTGIPGRTYKISYTTRFTQTTSAGALQVALRIISGAGPIVTTSFPFYVCNFPGLGTATSGATVFKTFNNLAEQVTVGVTLLPVGGGATTVYGDSQFGRELVLEDIGPA